MDFEVQIPLLNLLHWGLDLQLALQLPQSVSYFPNKGEKVKRANKFETPGPLTDRHGNITGEKTPLVSMVEDVPTTQPRKSIFPRSLESLKRPGVI
jgi:hypothetical protein